MFGAKEIVLKMDEKRRHSRSIRIRLEPEHDELIRDAAKSRGLTVSAWVRERLILMAREETKDEVKMGR
jgi:uncharacterized protein (DUF1778 family)